MTDIGSNLIQTPLGIETIFLVSVVTVLGSSNLIQTPLGIETKSHVICT